MKKAVNKSTLLSGIFLLATLSLANNPWKIEPNYSILFSGKKAEGYFSGLQGSIKFDKNDLSNSKIDVTVKVTTIKTGNRTKDKHALEDIWLNANNFPLIRFTSTSFQKVGDKFSVVGFLELHGIKKEIKFPFGFSENENTGLFEGSFSVNRKDYGIEGNLMQFLVGDNFKISVKVPVSKIN